MYKKTESQRFVKELLKSNLGFIEIDAFDEILSKSYTDSQFGQVFGFFEYFKR
jgi:hypothetical protein